MKKKSLNKKLVLKKGIISNLNLSNVKGGYKDMVTDEVISCDGFCFLTENAC